MPYHGIRHIRKMILLVACVATFTAGSSVSFAQDGTFTVSVDRATVGVGEQFELSFTLNGSTSADNFQPPQLNDFIVASGPNPSTNMQIINGAVSASITYTYVLQPKTAGKYTIGPASVSYKGKTLGTQPIVMTVTKGAAQPNRQGKGQDASDIGKQIGDNLLLRVMVDKSRVFQGEQITATYKLYTRVGIASYNVTKLPSLTGFWSEDLEVPRQPQLTNENFNGKQYRVAVFKKVALFPQRAGTLVLDPMEAMCVVQVQTRRRTNDFFDQFFNDPFSGGVTNVNYAARSEPLKITVQPLPAMDIPSSFNGAVGEFSLEAWLDKRQVKTNDPTTLKVKISGRGNLKLLAAPNISFPPDIEKYDPKISDNITMQGDQISGSRTFEYLLIPRHAGDQKIPTFVFSYFDLARKVYVMLNSPEFVLTVEKGSDFASSAGSGVSQEDVKLLGEDIRFIKSGAISFRRKGESFVGSAEFFTLTFMPVLGFIGFLVYTRKRKKMLKDVVSLRSRKARKTAQKRMKHAKLFLDQKKKEEFYTEVSRALWGYVGDRLGIPPSDLSIDQVKQVLQTRNVQEETSVKLLSTIEQCEFARFAPGEGTGQMDAMYREAVDLVSTIEDHIR
jgi:hypothetical protein